MSDRTHSVLVPRQMQEGGATFTGVSRGATSRATAMVFEDPVSRSLKRNLDRVAPSDATVLIIGETGTGKELVARYIHKNSPRKDGPFLAVNCGAFAETLVEAELFGHEKGSFTGATKGEVGWFEAANGGTLLLDEIGDLPPLMQVKLLRVLQEREVVRVGSRQSRPIDIRLIAATNVNLEQAVEAKKFRRDLLYRLNVMKIELAPLRARKGDISPLADYFLSLYGGKFELKDCFLAPAALNKLLNHSWPGNIRELENVIHNAILLAQDVCIDHVSIVQTEPETAPVSADFDTNLRRLFEEALANSHGDLYERVTRGLVSLALEKDSGNQVRAAETLGLSRNELRTQLAHMGLITPRRKGASHFPKLAPSKRHSVVRLAYQHFGTLAAVKAVGTIDERLQSAGYSVDWRAFSSGPPILDAIGSGEIDFGVTGEAATILALGMGAPFYYVGHESPAPGDVAIVVADESIRRVEDLRGKRVAFNKWSNADHFLMKALQRGGLSKSDIQPVYMPPDLSSLVDLSCGAIDAWVIWEPFLGAARKDRRARVLVDGVGHVENRQFYVCRRLFAASYPNIVELILDAIRDMSREEVVCSADDGVAAVARNLRLDATVAERYYCSLAFNPEAMDEQTVAEQQAIADAYFADGQLPARVSIASAVWRTL
ncbi:sigma 54-interacting transcriptional regulator [Methylocystis bryophila]|nr:sigma 54-interacting transcriptional regulator [Methylocystis bryophila]